MARSDMPEFTLGPLSESRSAPGDRQLVCQAADFIMLPYCHFVGNNCILYDVTVTRVYYLSIFENKRKNTYICCKMLQSLLAHCLVAV